MTDLTDIQTNDYGELSVQLATVGEVVGSDADGKPVVQNFTQEAFEKIAEDVNASGEPIAVDKDHSSMRQGLDRDTESMGWIDRLWATAKGLFGFLKFTRKGRELAEDRAYRFLSPSFVVDEAGVPVKLLNAAYTNQPACLGNKPILNNKPIEEDITNMSKDELISLIKETVTALNAAPTETKEETVETVNAKPAEETCNACGEDEKETVDEKPAEEIVEEVKEEIVEETKETETPETPAEEVKEEIKEEVKEEDDDEKEEVIKLEALNSRPNILAEVKGGKDWRNLHGDEFFKYLKTHKAEMVEECRN